jgi:hypothetical protein
MRKTNGGMRTMSGLSDRICFLVALAACALTAGIDWASAAEWVNPPLPQAEAPAPSPTPSPTPAAQLPARKRPAHPPPSQVATRSIPEASPEAVAPATSPLIARAQDFINAYWNNVGGAEPDVLGYLDSAYGRLVNYYGGTSTKQAVLAEKVAFINRWPIRRTWPQPGAENPKITCYEASSECTISGVRNFDNASPERGARVAGAFRYSYTVRFGDGPPQIVGEESAVVAPR